MSLNRVILFCGLIGILIISSCEDKDSKKNTVQTTTNEIPKTEEKSKVIDSTQEETKTQISEQEEQKKDSAVFKLTDDNVREFMKEYGKENPETLVRIETIYGSFDIKLYKETPLHRANFIYLVKEKYFDETFFYRAAKDFVIQGGNSDRHQMAKRRFEIGDYTVPQEQVKGLKHVRGAVALSKQWVDNPSNRSTPYEFFVVVAKKGAPHLDGEHTIFGKVVRGMNTVDKISNVPVDQSEWPKENIFIKATVIK